MYGCTFRLKNGKQFHFDSDDYDLFLFILDIIKVNGDSIVERFHNSDE